MTIEDEIYEGARRTDRETRMSWLKPLDHLRNHGFLYDPEDGKWRLTPAYDMNPVPITERSRNLTTWISEAGSEAAIDNLFEVAPEFLLKPQEAREIVQEVAEVTQQWRDIGRQIGLTDSDLSPYATAFEHEELALAQHKLFPSTSPESAPAKGKPPEPSGGGGFSP